MRTALPLLKTQSSDFSTLCRRRSKSAFICLYDSTSASDTSSWTFEIIIRYNTWQGVNRDSNQRPLDQKSRYNTVTKTYIYSCLAINQSRQNGLSWQSFRVFAHKGENRPYANALTTKRGYQITPAWCGTYRCTHRVSWPPHFYTSLFPLSLWQSHNSLHSSQTLSRSFGSGDYVISENIRVDIANKLATSGCVCMYSVSLVAILLVS